MPGKSELEKAMEHLASWGRQTIAFAMSLRAQRIENPIDSRERVVAANQETNALAQDLWESAFNECSQPVKAPEITIKFTAKVFDWVTDHLAD
jgi:hypothetical protein